MKFIFPLLFLTSIGIAQPKILDKVIAIIGKNPLLLSEVETTMLQQKEKMPDINKCRVFEDLLFQKLLLAQADRDSIVVSDNEVEAELTRRIQYYVGMLGSEEKFEEFYKKRISVFKDELRDDVKEQLMAQKMQQKITGDKKLTPNEVRTYFNSIPYDSLPLVNSELLIGHILKNPPVTEAERDAVKAKLEVYRQRVLNGESMSVMAALYSEDPGSAKNGGRYESVMRGQFVPEFEAVAFRLKPGEVSEVFSTTYGYHFIQLVARKGESVDVRHLLMSPQISAADISRAKQILDTVRLKIISGEISFKEAALKYSDDKDTKQNGGMLLNPATNTLKWELEDIGQVDPKLVFMFENDMKVGDVSPVIQYAGSDGKQAWRMMYLKSRTEPHKANMQDDYMKLMNMASFEHQKKAIANWISNKSQHTYIKIDNDFNTCKLEHAWTITK